ncbi:MULTISPECIES: helicase-exonuclease AddAB subunit AddB [unclassified Paenibacillus]|uniref:helicase-exonuclease AddAB subunit AddB n=1 Tax=unclassified Paenibacillus TaxID=185978 RepID=UPI001AE5C925|nr:MULTISPECIES: helicase-exonuclease AddAB subunit AddB [unclassified Paenibacillus]MBP1156343.1 ATP-dependent helicase/nuclease subunit B [Paenibacillus sp. PvP091]MBP1168271.1 ATP-dependent helicase/nuclease subunit B [Paenibacillus sp. PvR098]MBP2439299.1 ATP-dependent helicase/nuclease subunit B [Paenibacillus sp. PvP052]
MAFRFVLGRAGSGKTTFCLNEIKQRLMEKPEGRPLIWLVPEQATFQAEYALVSAPELGGTLRAQVLSFRRLAWRVMQEVGGTARLPIDETGKKLLLHRVIHRNKDRLRRFQASADQMGFLDNLNQLFSEFKRYCVTSEGLSRFYSERFGSLSASGGSLEDKLHDLQLIYGDFEMELSKLYLDGEDYLTLLAKQLGESDYVHDAECWVDGFHGFTPQEFAVLEQLAQRARNVTLTLCLDRPYLNGEGLYELDLFHPTARTMLELQERLRQQAVDVAEHIVLSDSPPARFGDNPMLAYLEAHWGDRVKKPFTDKGEVNGGSSVRISAAVSRRAEVEGLARDIVKLVRDGGLRWRDISVSVRSVEAYGDLLAGTFRDYGIPHFFDQKRSVMHHPVVELIRSALETVLNYWKYDAVFRCVKTGLFLPFAEERDPQGGKLRIDRLAMDQLENYVLAFGIQGSKWTDPKDWTYSNRTNLEQDEAEARAADEAFLTKINACRRAVAEPLMELQNKLREKTTVQDRVRAVYELLIRLQVPERLEAWSQASLRCGEPEKAREHAQVWERIMDVFDQLAELMGEQSTSLDLFAELIQTGFESIKLGLVPPTLDQVLIGSMDRTRSGRVKHMFVLGVNEGVMPAKITESGVLTEAERERLGSAGLQTAEGSRRRLLDESFLIYCAFCTPSDGLWLSYPLADEEGKSLLPSDVIRQIKRLFPHTRERLLFNDPASDASSGEQLEYVAHSDKALSLLVVQLKQWMQGSPMSGVWWSVYNWFARQPEFGWKLSRMIQSLLYTNKAPALSDPTSRQLYGEHIETSVSRMERFVACPFSQFASHGLRLKERRIFRLEAPDVGQLFHAALSKFAEQVEMEGVDWGALTARESEERAALVVDALAPKLQGEILLSSKRYLYIARKLKQVISRAALMLGEHAKRGQFRPIGLEIGFGNGQPIPPLIYELNNGVRMELRGRIDRIDRADTEQGTLLRVIDYKSSAKMLNMAEVYYGLSLQMLTYLDVILTHAPIWLGKEAEPAGVLYFHVHNPILNAKNGLTVEQIDKELKKRFKMKGLLKADPEVIGLMDSSLIGASGHSELLPAALKTDGSFYKTSSVASEAQWNTVRGYVRRTIREIGTSMTDGRIDIEPYRMGQSIACTNCSYRSVCQFDTQLEGNDYKVLPPIGKDLVWELMEKQAEPKRRGSVSGFRPAASRILPLAALEIAASTEDESDALTEDELNSTSGRKENDGGET